MEDKVKHIVYKFLDDVNFIRHEYLSHTYNIECYYLYHEYVFRYHFDDMHKIILVHVEEYIVYYVMKFIPIDYEVMSNIIEEWIKERYGK